MNKRKYKTKSVKAKKLMQDDRFRLAGQTYRIADLVENETGERITIKFYAIEPLARISALQYLVVDKNVKFRIYYR